MPACQAIRPAQHDRVIETECRHRSSRVRSAHLPVAGMYGRCARQAGCRRRRTESDHGPPRHAAREADARQVRGEDPAGDALRGQVGRFPCDRVPRRGRGGAGEPYGQAADQVFPGAGGGGAGAAARAVRGGRGDRHRAGRSPGLRRAHRADPSGRLPGADPRGAHAGLAGGLRPAGAGRRVPARRGAGRPAGAAGAGAVGG